MASDGYKTGFAREIITPPLGAPLAGYFVPRPSTAVLDDLEVKVALFQAESATGKMPVPHGIVLLDLLFVSRELLARIRAALRDAGLPAADELVVAATHTHTGPYVNELFGGNCVQQGYLDKVARATARAVQRALADMRPSELRCGSASRNTLAFCRRFFMADGRVVTNPGKRNPAVRAPEGAVEREIRVLAVRQGGELAALLANIANHADTTGGDQISRDWPGHFEARIQELAGSRIPAFALIAPSGNLNHFDVTTDDPQTSVDEARRIGRAYADAVWEMLPGLQPIEPGEVRAQSARVPLVFRSISDAEVARAREVIAETGGTGSPQQTEAARGTRAALTSEDLADGGLAVRRVFARELVAFAEREQGRTEEYQLTALRIGQRLAFVSLPGEPFAELGIRLREASPFPTTFVIAHANGTCGYVPLAECFARGGYETLPVVGGGVGEDAAERLLRAGLEQLGA